MSFKKETNVLWKCNKVRSAARWYSFVWPRYLVSPLVRKFIVVCRQGLSWGDHQDWMKLLVSKTTSLWCFVYLNHREQLFAHVYANTESVWAAWIRNCGVASGMKRPNSAVPRESHFAFSVSLHRGSISSICMCDGAFSTATANWLLISWNLLFCAPKPATWR